jgi:pyrroloquinoline quinone biosynthesis protein B
MRLFLSLAFLLLVRIELWAQSESVSLIVLGNVQDGGSPHIACKKDCCRELFESPDQDRKVVCLGLVDEDEQKTYLFDATPDFPAQIKMLKRHAGFEANEVPDGIFLTHAHIGHYTGLMYLGKEAMGSSDVPVYAMPRMKSFLQQNGPWNQLIELGNINLNEMHELSQIQITKNAKVIPILVPHRDEFSEAVGYKIQGPNKSALFIPDIDKWDKWDHSIIEEIRKVDYAFLDATFFDAEEVNHRDISEIPHPFIVESMQLMNGLSKEEKRKVHFIHLNHANPALDPASPQSKLLHDAGYNIARIRDTFLL